MNDETSTRLALPLLQAGQAQKEMTHNEALALIDLAIGACVRDIDVNDPPAAPSVGDCWIVGETPTGAWTGHADAIAGWTGAGWRFVAPVDGLSIWVSSANLPARFASGAWHVGDIRATRVSIEGVQVLGAQAQAIAGPAGGATVDAECRAVLEAVLATLRAHGIIAA